MYIFAALATVGLMFSRRHHHHRGREHLGDDPVGEEMMEFVGGWLKQIILLVLVATFSICFFPTTRWSAM